MLNVQKSDDRSRLRWPDWKVKCQIILLKTSSCYPKWPCETSSVKHSFTQNSVAAYVTRFVPVSYLLSLNAHIHEKCTLMFTVWFLCTSRWRFRLCLALSCTLNYFLLLQSGYLFILKHSLWLTFGYSAHTAMAPPQLFRHLAENIHRLEM